MISLSLLDIALTCTAGGLPWIAGKVFDRFKSTHSQPRRKRGRRTRYPTQPQPTAPRADPQQRDKAAAIAARWPDLPAIVDVLTEHEILIKPQTPEQRLQSMFYAFQRIGGKRLRITAELRNEIAQALGKQPAEILISPSVKGRPALFSVEVMAYAERRQQTEASPLQVTIGTDDRGNPRTVDLAAMPHMLIAGPTGTGKSMLINNLLLSLAEHTDAGELELIIIDPKAGTEFTLYGDTDSCIPQLIAPIIADMSAVAGVLDEAIAEMDRRYRLFVEYTQRWKQQTGQRVHVANIGQYNAHAAAHPHTPGAFELLPYRVILIDEFADLIALHGDIIRSVSRLGQKARAAGVHLILATQRPNAQSVPMELRACCQNGALSFKTLDSDGSIAVLGLPDAKSLPPVGVALLQHNGLHRIHTRYLSSQELIERVEALHVSPPRYRIAPALSTPTSLSADSDIDQSIIDDPELRQLLGLADEHRDRKGGITKRMIMQTLRCGDSHAGTLQHRLIAAGILTKQGKAGTKVNPETLDHYLRTA